MLKTKKIRKQRRIKIKETRRKRTRLINLGYPEAEKSCLVQGNLRLQRRNKRLFLCLRSMGVLLLWLEILIKVPLNRESLSLIDRRIQSLILGCQFLKMFQWLTQDQEVSYNQHQKVQKLQCPVRIQDNKQCQLHHNCNSESSMCQEYRFALQLWSQLKTDKAIYSCNKNKEKIMAVYHHHLYLLKDLQQNTPLITVKAHQLLLQLLIDELQALSKYYQLGLMTLPRKKTKQNTERLLEPKMNLNSRQTGVVYL